MGPDETSSRIIRAVRAEAARSGVTGKELSLALGRDKKYVYERFRFEKPFSTSDLDQIARHLGITIDTILESAQFELHTRPSAAA